MGQSSSSDSASPPPRRPVNHHRLHTLSSSGRRPETLAFTDDTTTTSTIDYTYEIPDECLALVFNFLSSGDRKRCSLVSRRWLIVEGQSRRRLALNARSDLLPFIPSTFSRFDSVTKLALRCDRRSISIGDDGLNLISSMCPNLTRLKLRGCREITDLGMAVLANNCNGLKKLSVGSCAFGAKGVNALLDNCSSLEELSVKRLRGGSAAAIGRGAAAAAASSLTSVCLKELYNGQVFAPLIVGSKNLKTLKLLRCLGDWDGSLEMIAVSENCLVEVHLERIHVSDIGLSALSNCRNLEVLHIVKTPECTNLGLIAVAENCRYLRKLHIDGWRTNMIGNDGLIAVGKHSVNLVELVLIGVNVGFTSLEAIAINCRKLERLALCGSETITDVEMACIASKCVGLKKLCIKGCNVSNEGIEAIGWGCPNLVKIKVKKCRNVTFEVGDWLRARRGSLVVNLDVCAVEVEVEPEVVVASASDNGDQEDVVVGEPEAEAVAVAASSSSCANGGRSSVFRTRFGLFGGRRSFMRWSNGN